MLTAWQRTKLLVLHLVSICTEGGFVEALVVLVPSAHGPCPCEQWGEGLQVHEVLLCSVPPFREFLVLVDDLHINRSTVTRRFQRAQAQCARSAASLAIGDGAWHFPRERAEQSLHLGEGGASQLELLGGP